MRIWTAVFLAVVTLVLGFFAASANEDEFWEEAPTDEPVINSTVVPANTRRLTPPAGVKSLAIPKELPIGDDQFEVKSVDITSPAEESMPLSTTAAQADGEPVCCEHISIDIALERKPSDKPEPAVPKPRN